MKKTDRIITFPNCKIADFSYRPDKYSPFHKDGTNRISILLNGQIKESNGKETHYAKTASFVIKAADAQHNNLYGPKGARVLSVGISTSLADGIFNTFMDRWQWFHGVSVTKSIFPLVKILKSDTSEIAIIEGLTELFASLPPTLPSKVTLAPDWLSLLEERLLDEYDTNLQTAELAEWLDLHPVYLARVFRKFHHVSIQDFIQKKRIENVINNIASTPTSLAHLAFDNGFADQSHLNRVFKKWTGSSPGQFRILFKA